ncbi:ATP-grasp domain-containing protein [Methanosarcina sp. UBA5]|uniref:ATP-grasp domain-containing protein n=1 Tax=Methanosarcina sp. UBA5 TaxID=1915593 RepID=UPI0025CCE574|nr:ATP-grasp domain-containing protein [Methanosarcina sp. UBA5]
MQRISLSGVKVHRIPPASHPLFLEKLYTLAVEESIQLLIPTVSEELPILASEWKKWSDIPAVIGQQQAVSDADDKFLTYKRLSSHGVCVPRYLLPSQVSSPEEISLNLGWPCLSKPRVSRGGREVVIRNIKDWPAISMLDDRYILQEFIPGTEYAPNVYIGKKAVIVVLEKTKLKEGIVGNAAEVKRVNAPDVADIARSAAKAMNLTGPMDIDIRRRNDHNPVVLEINARFGANIARAEEVLDAVLEDFGDC